MSEMEKWMPTDEELLDLLSCVGIQQALGEIRDTIREAVERALAEQEARELQDFLGWKEQEEARHKREVIEARIAEIENWYDSDADDAIGIRLTDLRAELAALDKEAKGE